MQSFAESGWNVLGSVSVREAFLREYLGGTSTGLNSPVSDSDAFFDALRSIQQSQSGLDRTFQGFSEATLGVHPATDPNGTSRPILEPNMPYEKEGQVPNVVFPCGNVLMDGKLLASCL